jgi:hypothetical protein
MDLMGPISPATNDDERYALNVIDEFSEMSATILLMSKADAAKGATNLLNQWQTQNECKVKFIRTDNGTEFAGLKKFCRKNGAVHQKTAPYAHQQNGKLERLNRTLQDKARAMLAASGLSPEFWGDALLTANYLRNLSTVANHDKTPYELWFGSVPDVSHLRIFGSKCYVVIYKSKRDGKFTPVSQQEEEEEEVCPRQADSLRRSLRIQILSVPKCKLGFPSPCISGRTGRFLMTLLARIATVLCSSRSHSREGLTGCWLSQFPTCSKQCPQSRSAAAFNTSS